MPDGRGPVSGSSATGIGVGVVVVAWTSEGLNPHEKLEFCFVISETTTQIFSTGLGVV